MWSLFFRKPKKQLNQQTIEERLRMTRKTYEEKQEELRYRYEVLQRDLRVHYEEKIDEGRLYEKDLPFQQILEDAQKGTHPFEYTIERGSIHYTKMVFFRSKQSPNPFQITIEVHKNCIFLGVSKGKREKVADNFITLYYDKVKKVYQEYEWRMSCDYATKHHMRMFLYEMMKHVKEDCLHAHPYYKSEFRARDEFWAKEHVWLMEYEDQLKVLRLQREQALDMLEQAYERERAPYLMKIEEIEKKKLSMQLLEEEKEEINIEEKKEVLQQRVFDEHIDEQMKRVYQYAQQLLEKEVLLDIEQAYQLRTLYEKDLQELWRSFIQLEEKKQKREKKRFQTMLIGLEKHLNAFEERIVQMEAFDYEKKMNYMERKYLS